jgi:ABC-type antimicrobial peptide transport system permease subunit
MPLAAITSMGEQFDEVTALPRRLAIIVAGFASAAVLLALIGVYGLMAYVVGQRQKEIGVRMALGAAPERLMQWLLGEGIRLTVVGVAIGLVVALAATRLLQSNLHGVTPLDPVVLVSVPLVIGAAAILASWLPARRARLVDPVKALRAE